MKVNIDYNLLHDAIYNLQTGYELTKRQADAVLELCLACENDYYPSKEELQLQQKRISLLTESLYKSNKERYMSILSECIQFENKFC